MRKIFITSLLLITTAYGFSAVRTLQEKIAAAASVLNTTNVKGIKGTTATQKLKELKTLDELTIMGYENGAFAVIANNDNYAPVVGYSTTPLATEMPCGFSWWLNSVNEVMKNNANSDIQTTAIKYKAAKNESLAPLLKSMWGQGTPYNNLCPTETNGKPYPTGCVATAMSQIMYYHKYPQHGAKYHIYSFKPSAGEGRVIEANFADTYYDWDNMLDAYSTNTYSDTQAKAVATLMLHCGVGVEMQYTASGSGAYTHEACSALRTYFKYNKNIGIHYRDYYSAEEWMKLIYNELDNNRPVLYGGQDTRNGGHSFVLDGYDANGLVHVNWGWDGSQNGYYDISLLNPGGFEFSTLQNMLTGFTDSTVVIPHHSEPICNESQVNIVKLGSRISVMCGEIYNMSDFVFNGQVGIILEGMGKVYELKTLQASAIPTLYSITSKISGMLPLPDNLAEGTYRVYVATKDSVETSWQPVHFSTGSNNSYVLTVSASDFTIKADSDATWMGVDPIKAEDATAGKINVYDVSGRIVYSAPAATFNTENIDKHGLFIIKNGTKVTKVMR